MAHIAAAASRGLAWQGLASYSKDILRAGALSSSLAKDVTRRTTTTTTTTTTAATTAQARDAGRGEGFASTLEIIARPRLVTHAQASTATVGPRREGRAGQLHDNAAGRSFGAPYSIGTTAGARAAAMEEKVGTSEAYFDGSMETVVASDPSDLLQDRYEYRIEVHTGELRGAGTASDIYINLIGNLHHTGECLLRSPDEEDGETEEFKTGSLKTFYLQAPNLLGRISGIEVSLGKGSAGLEKKGSNAGWYVEKLTVYSPTGKRLEFPCKCWFGRSESGAWGPSKRKLIPFVSPVAGRLTSFGKILPKKLEVRSGAFVAPHLDKVKKGVKAKNCKEFGHAGEDAYFKCTSKSGLTYGMGVADGVYMWSEYGIDAGEFSKALVTHAREEVKEKETTSVSEVIKRAAESARGAGVLGSSTICLCLVDTVRGTAQVAHLGDSGVLIVGKEGVVKLKTPQQEHSFGFPFQLGHHDRSDRPEDALVSVVSVEAGDVIVVGSDGLFDNLSDAEVAACAIEGRRGGGRGTKADAGAMAAATANELGRRAFENSLDKKIATPYSIAATEAFSMIYSGGKSDDITIVVACIV